MSADITIDDLHAIDDPVEGDIALHNFIANAIE